MYDFVTFQWLREQKKKGRKKTVRKAWLNIF